MSQPQIAPATGKLGVLTVGLGAVSSTLIAGVELAKRGQGEPIGSLTQMGTIRLGKRTDGRSPLIKDFVPLADLDDLVFGAWDPFPDDAYVAAQRAGVLESGSHLEGIAEALRDVRPMPAVFDRSYVKRLDGEHTKGTIDKRSMLNAIREDINTFREEKQVDRVVMVWCGIDRDLHRAGPGAPDDRGVRGRDRRERPDDRPVDALRLRRDPGGRAVRQRRPQPDRRHPGAARAGGERGVPIGGKDFKTGQTLIKTVLGPSFKARMLGLNGWYSTNILGNRDGEVLDDPESFKTKEESKLGVLEHILAAGALPRALRQRLPQGADQLLPAARRQQGGLGQHRHLRLARLPDADQGRLPVPRLDPGRADRARPGAVHATSPSGPAWAASRSGCPSTSRARWWPPASTPSTTCSSSSRSSRTRCAG